ncbi:hypothetical protein M752DRAFT_273385 [Aspergillus phoenicis ATCC 13157]|uniref:Uncharacterized protein n=1 Tax=Aspergillus phoenicis ATCC 13157 TaxID=1353007 RepID=A0A370PVT0_ASPPH|nr:hypothetical protein M752DRAFT_273385 [Aspergillus phoenicis ATCC 13157]
MADVGLRAVCMRDLFSLGRCPNDADWTLDGFLLLFALSTSTGLALGFAPASSCDARRTQSSNVCPR